MRVQFTNRGETILYAIGTKKEIAALKKSMLKIYPKGKFKTLPDKKSFYE